DRGARDRGSGALRSLAPNSGAPRGDAGHCPHVSSPSRARPMTFASTAINIVNFVAGAIYVLILARIFISWLPISPWNPLVRLLRTGADPWHPLVVGVRSMTNPLVRPFAGLGRRGFHRGLDIPALATLIAYVVLYVVIEVVFRRLLAGI